MLFSPQLCVRYFDGNPSPWLTHFLGNCSVIEGCDPDKIKYMADYTVRHTDLAVNLFLLSRATQ